MTKKQTTKKKLALSVTEVENGWMVRINSEVSEDDYSYHEKTHVFLTSNALVDFIENLF